MTEAEWLACRDPDRMLDYLGEAGVPSQRKLRLLAVSCCARIVHLCPEPTVFRTTLETAEQFADGGVPEQEMIDADGVLAIIERKLENNEGDEPDESDAAHSRYHAMQAVGQVLCLDTAECPYFHRMRDVVLHVANAVAFESIAGAGCETAKQKGLWERTERAERGKLAGHVRDVFGNPFRPFTIAPAVRTTDVKLLARGIHLETAFDRMPILADALQDAGCDNDEVLNHCRDATQVHVRGCWVIDLVLSKE